VLRFTNEANAIAMANDTRAGQTAIPPRVGAHLRACAPPTCTTVSLPALHCPHLPHIHPASYHSPHMGGRASGLVSYVYTRDIGRVWRVAEVRMACCWPPVGWCTHGCATPYRFVALATAHVHERLCFCPTLDAVAQMEPCTHNSPPVRFAVGTTNGDGGGEHGHHQHGGSPLWWH